MTLKNQLFSSLFIVFFCSVGGYFYGLRAANEAHEAQQSKAMAAVEQTLRTYYEQQLATANNSVATLRQEKSALAKAASELEKRIAHVSRPDCPITRGFVGLYNRAIGADLPPSDHATGADRAASTAVTPASSAPQQKQDTTVSDVNQQDILRHVVNYGQRCQSLEAQLIQLIEYEETVYESRRPTGASHPEHTGRDR
ncbi:hypothetical protein [Neptunomonas antarctica]|uniref:Prophage endopeptidase n=1 Tax=Neptunomonas antarctica TaxID=619304 RepID=A0A1N7MQA2_9GAMM|nr:hypothetical protein [Neptunomonas antarctica]SIS88111.1 hypothetical protein SAMN05421760_106252 [Neptunomonas antarctica]